MSCVVLEHRRERELARQPHDREMCNLRKGIGQSVASADPSLRFEETARLVTPEGVVVPTTDPAKRGKEEGPRRLVLTCHRRESSRRTSSEPACEIPPPSLRSVVGMTIRALVDDGASLAADCSFFPQALRRRSGPLGITANSSRALRHVTFEVPHS